MPVVPAPAGGGRLSPARAGVLFTVALGVLLAAISLYSTGSQDLGQLTTLEIALQLVGGGTLVVAILAAAGRPRLPGLLVAALMTVLAVYTAMSIMWAVNPSDAWIEANRTFTYLVVLLGGGALCLLAPNRWAAVIGATVLAAFLICAYALATKIFAAWLSPDEVNARLQAPYGYWNAVGLAACLGVPGTLWWGTRRDGHGAGRALAAPVLAVLLLTNLLAYSRGSLVALVVGAALWVVLAPVRLRSAALLIIGGVGAGLAWAWTLNQDALSEDHVPLAARDVAGHRFGLVVLAMLLLVLAANLALAFFSSRRPLVGAARRRVGVVLLVLLALVPVAVVGKLATSDRGLGGSISHTWSQLTDPHATGVANDASRLTAVASVRSKYWDEALRIWDDHQLVGAGAGGYATIRGRYRDDAVQVQHAHGYMAQTLADLGAIGAAISLALTGVWLWAAGRALGGWRTVRGPLAEDPERLGMVALVALVITFGVHSFVDWTWFILGNASIAMLAIGWTAARGRLLERPPQRPAGLWPSIVAGVRTPPRIVAAVLAAVFVLTLAWGTLQPERSANASDNALTALSEGKIAAAQQDAKDAASANPLSVDPLFDEAAIASRQKNVPAARAALSSAIALQPANVATWLTLAQYDLAHDDLPGATSAVSAALYLDPHAREVQQTFLNVRTQSAAIATAAAQKKAAAAAKKQAKADAKKRKAAAKRTAAAAKKAAAAGGTTATGTGAATGTGGTTAGGTVGTPTTIAPG